MRLAPQSLFGQILLAQCLILASTAIGALFALSWILGAVADDFAAAQLRADADRIGGSLVRGESGWQVGRPLRLGPLYDRAAGSRAFVVVAGNGQVIARSTARIRFPAEILTRPSAERFMHAGPLDLLVRPLSSEPGGPWIAIVQDRQRPEVIVDDVVSAFLVHMSWVLPAAMLVSLLFAALFVRRATRAIASVSREADAIEPGRLGVRLSADRLPTEAQPLVRAANLALDRVEAGYKAQDEFVANVAHELRTPLALVSLRLESVADPELRDALREGIQRTSHVVSQLMELASVEHWLPELEPVDLADLARDAVEAHAPLVFRGERSIEYQVAPGPAPRASGAPGLIRIALANLIDNAMRHTPAGTRILVSVGPDCAIRVADDGVGIEADAFHLARRRYWRADARRSDSAGLGLAIVERVMTAQKGSLRLTRAEGGGALVILTFQQQA